MPSSQLILTAGNPGNSSKTLETSPSLPPVVNFSDPHWIKPEDDLVRYLKRKISNDLQAHFLPQGKDHVIACELVNVYSLMVPVIFSDPRENAPFPFIVVDSTSRYAPNAGRYVTYVHKDPLSKTSFLDISTLRINWPKGILPSRELVTSLCLYGDKFFRDNPGRKTVTLSCDDFSLRLSRPEKHTSFRFSIRDLTNFRDWRERFSTQLKEILEQERIDSLSHWIGIGVSEISVPEDRFEQSLNSLLSARIGTLPESLKHDLNTVFFSEDELGSRRALSAYRTFLSLNPRYFFQILTNYRFFIEELCNEELGKLFVESPERAIGKRYGVSPQFSSLLKGVALPKRYEWPPGLWIPSLYEVYKKYGPAVIPSFENDLKGNNFPTRVLETDAVYNLYELTRVASRQLNRRFEEVFSQLLLDHKDVHRPLRGIAFSPQQPLYHQEVRAQFFGQIQSFREFFHNKIFRPAFFSVAMQTYGSCCEHLYRSWLGIDFERFFDDWDDAPGIIRSMQRWSIQSTNRYEDSIHNTDLNQYYVSNLGLISARRLRKPRIWPSLIKGSFPFPEMKPLRSLSLEAQNLSLSFITSSEGIRKVGSKFGNCLLSKPYDVACEQGSRHIAVISNEKGEFSSVVEFLVSNDPSNPLTLGDHEGFGNAEAPSADKELVREFLQYILKSDINERLQEIEKERRAMNPDLYNKSGKLKSAILSSGWQINWGLVQSCFDTEVRPYLGPRWGGKSLDGFLYESGFIKEIERYISQNFMRYKASD